MPVKWYHSFLDNRQKRIVHNNHFYECKGVNKGTTHRVEWAAPIYLTCSWITLKLGKVPLPPFSRVQMTLLLSHHQRGKAGRDTSSGSVEEFMTWANCNSIKCNPNKCKELFIKKKGNSTSYTVACNIPQRDTLELLSLTFQNDCKFSVHAKAKLRKANKCLHLLRVRRKERYSQTEIDYRFYSIVRLGS